MFYFNEWLVIQERNKEIEIDTDKLSGIVSREIRKRYKKSGYYVDDDKSMMKGKPSFSFSYPNSKINVWVQKTKHLLRYNFSVGN